MAKQPRAGGYTPPPVCDVCGAILPHTHPSAQHYHNIQEGMMKNATRDQIVQAIRVLWERDWLVSADTIQSQLLKGQHVKASLIECRDTYLAIQDTRDAWMAQFDPAVLAERRKLFDQKKP